MADITKIRLSGSTYNIKDENALHVLDTSVTSGGTNAVNGAGIYNAIASALETVAEQGYQTSGDVQNAISGKADTTAVTQSIEAAVSGKADYSGTVTSVSATSQQSSGMDVELRLSVTKGGTGTANTFAKFNKSHFTKTGDSIGLNTTNVALKSDIPSVNGYADAVKYNSTSKYVEFYHGGTGGTKVFEYDASPFLIDGMVSNVEIKEVTGKGTCLVITFNSDAGKQSIEIPISQIFDASNYYTKSEVNTELAKKANTATTYTKTEVNNAINAATSGKVDTSTFNTYSGSVNTALAGKANTATTYTKTETDNAISGYTTGYTYDKQTIDDKISQSGTFDPTQYYNKTATDALLAGKNQVIGLDGETLVIS